MESSRGTTRGSYFNPRGPCGPRRRLPGHLASAKDYFNPRGPCGPRPQVCCDFPFSLDFNPRGPCGPRLAKLPEQKKTEKISILAVLADRDKTDAQTHLQIFDFNPRGPCGPRRVQAAWHLLPVLFQSSRSLRTATRMATLSALRGRFQSSRSLRTATPSVPPVSVSGPIFQSSRSLRTATSSAVAAVAELLIFQSSRSLRTATVHIDVCYPGVINISILAVLADRDLDVHDNLIPRDISILAVLADRDPNRAPGRAAG